MHSVCEFWFGLVLVVAKRTLVVAFDDMYC